MQQVDNQIREAVQFIRNLEETKKLASKHIEKIHLAGLNGISSNQFFEKDFLASISPVRLNERVSGVDSGFVDIHLYGIDFVLIRAMSVSFDYAEGKLINASYLPSFYQFPEPFVSKMGIELDEFQVLKSLKRLKQEILLSIKTMREKRPKYLFMDGSLVPQYADKPRPASRVSDEYFELLRLFQELYQTSISENCTLIATVEDSRGQRLLQLLQSEVLPHFPFSENAKELWQGLSDSSLLDFVLKKNQRTMAFSYSSNPAENQILSDFKPEFANNIYAFYLKASDLERPLRVEFLKNNSNEIALEKLNEIASVVLALSSLHREYSYPSILIEADLRAKLKPEEIQLISDKILDQLRQQRSSLPLRRNSRPF